MPKRAILIVDHGSVRNEANAMLEEMAHMLQEIVPSDIVYYCHMDLAEPSISQGFDYCVRQGAERIIVFPYFLSPGRHSTQDIPRMVDEAARCHPGVTYAVAAPFGLHPLMCQMVLERVAEAEAQVVPRENG